jgi:hypothetical protein
MFTKLIIQRKPNERLFDEIIGCEDIKRLFRMALDPAEPVHILLSGAPASAKTLFLQALMKLRDSYFVDGSNTTKSGMIDYIFHNKPKYLLIDEIDKMFATKKQIMAINPSNEKIKEQAQSLIRSINFEMKAKFETFKQINYNPNTKGFDYEKTLSSLLNIYLGAVFDIYNRASLIDVNMEYLEIFSTGENEIDIIAVYKNTFPKVVTKIEDTNFIPYDSVGFIIEVKSRLDKTNLSNDLTKLEKISKLKLSSDRLGSAIIGGSDVVDRPLRILFYYQKARIIA